MPVKGDTLPAVIIARNGEKVNAAFKRVDVTVHLC